MNHCVILALMIPLVVTFHELCHCAAAVALGYDVEEVAWLPFLGENPHVRFTCSGVADYRWLVHWAPLIVNSLASLIIWASVYRNSKFDDDARFLILGFFVVGAVTGLGG